MHEYLHWGAGADLTATYPYGAKSAHLLDNWVDGLEGKERGPLGFRENCVIIYKGVEGLAVFVLKHHFDLPPAPFALVFYIGIYVQGF